MAAITLRVVSLLARFTVFIIPLGSLGKYQLHSLCVITLSINPYAAGG